MRWASWGETSSTGSPKVFAHAASRLSSSIRSWLGDGRAADTTTDDDGAGVFPQTLLGGCFCGGDVCGSWHPALGKRVVDGTHDHYHSDGCFEDRNVAERGRNVEIGQGAQWRVAGGS